MLEQNESTSSRAGPPPPKGGESRAYFAPLYPLIDGSRMLDVRLMLARETRSPTRLDFEIGAAAESTVSSACVMPVLLWPIWVL